MSTKLWGEFGMVATQAILNYIQSLLALFALTCFVFTLTGQFFRKSSHFSECYMNIATHFRFSHFSRFISDQPTENYEVRLYSEIFKVCQKKNYLYEVKFQLTVWRPNFLNCRLHFESEHTYSFLTLDLIDVIPRNAETFLNAFNGVAHSRKIGLWTLS